MSTIANRPSLGVIVLGAGASSRMGRPKLLLPWKNTTVLGHIICQWRELGAGQIAIVVRVNDAALVAELDRLGFPADDRIVNPQPERGMFSSIQCAANWAGWKSDIRTWAVTLGDQPHLRWQTLEMLLEFQAGHANAICQPEFGRHARHPVLLPWKAFLELKHSQVETFNLFLKQTSCPSVKCSVQDPGLSLDMDTPEDYIRLQDSI